MDHWPIKNTFSVFYSAIDNHEVDEVRRLLRTENVPVNGNVPYGVPPIIECIELCRGKEDEPKTLEILKLLVQHGADVNVRSHFGFYFGMTAAMVAADLGLDSCLRFLVESGTDLTLRANYEVNHFEAKKRFCENQNGKTALMMAASGSDDANALCVKFLVEAGVDLNVLDKFGNTALMYAAEAGGFNSVKYLTERMSASSLNQTNKKGQTALMMAAKVSNDAPGLCVKFLVEAGVDLNVQDEFGNTALMLAAVAGGFNSVKYLTERMSVSSLNQTNKKGQTALMMAAKVSNDAPGLCVKFLVEAGVDLNVQDEFGNTALMLAAVAGGFNSVKYLTERISVSSLNQTNKKGQTALMRAASNNSSEQTSCLKCLVEAGADVNVQCKRGYTALMSVSVSGSVESVKLLTERMSVSTLNQANDHGQTALMLAVSYYGTDNAEILKHIVEAGADVNIQCKRGYTALMKVASSYKVRESHLEYLITAGTDLNVAHTKTGYTALMFAIDRGDDRAVSLLLEKGALVNIVTPDLKTPLFLLSGLNRLMTPISSLDSGLIIGKIPELLSHGLDPALSYRDQEILHTMVVKGKKSLVRGLVMNGFPPVDVQITRSLKSFNRYIFHIRRHGTPVSPLSMALASERRRIARYLIVNRFFTRYDLVQLCRDKELRQYLQRKPKCLEILDFLSARPYSLRDLCFVTISSALSQYLVHDPLDIPPGDSRWMCKPTFRERVDLLQLPPALKRELLHDTPSSSISCESWGNIPLE